MSLAASGCCGKFSLIFLRHVRSKLLQLCPTLCDPMDCRERLRAGGQGDRGREDEMVGWHCLLNEHEFEQTEGDNEGLGSLACCSPWGLKELDMN